MAPELYHGFTTQGQPWRLGSSLTYLLGNVEDSRRPSASSRCFSFVLAALWWTDGCGGRWRQRQFIEGHLGQRGSRTGPGTGQAGRPGPTGPSLFRSGSTPSCSLMLLGQLLTSSLMHVGPWRRLLHGLDRAPCRASFSIFCSGPWSFTTSCFCPWAIWSHGHDVSWLVLGLMIFPWSARWTYLESLLLSASSLRKQQTPKSTCKSELDTSGG
jgi:hypothetical protein